MYSINTIIRIPPTIDNALWYQFEKNALPPDSLASGLLFDAKILLLFSRKKIANTGIYTKNWINLSNVNNLKKGHINLKSKVNTFTAINSSTYINKSMERTIDVLPRASPWESGHGNDGCTPKDVLHHLWPARPVRPRLMI